VTADPGDRYARAVRRKASRVVAARRRRDPRWRHAANVGVLGWLLVLPLLGGAFAGRFLAARTGVPRLALAGLLVGLAIGVLLVARQLRASLRSGDDDHEERP
jgi:ATP synthase protein I